ncbi:hypothetical protein ACROYT_G023777 [Oculina patagonica]
MEAVCPQFSGGYDHYCVNERVKKLASQGEYFTDDYDMDYRYGIKICQEADTYSDEDRAVRQYNFYKPPEPWATIGKFEGAYATGGNNWLMIKYFPGENSTKCASGERAAVRLIIICDRGEHRGSLKVIDDPSYQECSYLFELNHEAACFDFKRSSNVWSVVLRQRTNEAFDKIKKAVTSTPVPKYFDTSKPTEGSGDASSKGVGFVLTQDDHPVTYASRALTQAEQHYSQIKEEFLAQVFGLEHNHQYVYGRNSQEEAKPEEEVEIIHAKEYLVISEVQLNEIKQANAKDSTLQLLQTLKQMILKDWPDSKASVPVEIIPYFNIREELAVQDGILFKGPRCIISQSLRKKLKVEEKIHRAHTGVQSCLRRAQ